jgi:steroid delta-isomerase-like uncharacterized protein
VEGCTVRHIWTVVGVVALSLAIVLVGDLRPVDAQTATPAASPATGCPTTTEDQNEAIARRWHEEAINTHDLAVLDEILAPDVTHESASFSDNPGPRAVLGALLTGFPDVQHTIDAVITEGDHVVVRYTATGTQSGEFQGMASTGKMATWTGINIFRIECGRIAEVWSENDALGRLEQLTGAATAATPSAP